MIQGYLLRLGLTQGLKQELGDAIAQSTAHNAWFTEQHIKQALGAIATEMLTPRKLKTWLASYSSYLLCEKESKKIGIVMAGNLPLVGFHDLLCVLGSGHIAVVKLSSKDPYLLPMLKCQLTKIDYTMEHQIIFVEQMDASAVDAVIATGSDNTVTVFETQFEHLPHIFRKSKSSLAVLAGNETTEQLQGLAHDMLDYFGMGCRNVSKLFVPRNYDFTALQQVFAGFSFSNANFAGAYRYAKALCLARQEPMLDFDYFLLQANEAWNPLTAQAFFEMYDDAADLQHKLQRHRSGLQCLVSAAPIADFEHFYVDFGNTQRPQLNDYADGVDTMKFIGQLTIDN
ncbi:acyl-CoA reductase [Bacteroidia bacterium]|nr:acyl-CoA reductase [Bacteroidia bacterium]